MEWIETMRITARKKYGVNLNNPRLEYVLHFLDSLENDLTGFIDAGYEVSEIDVRYMKAIPDTKKPPVKK